MRGRTLARIGATVAATALLGVCGFAPTTGASARDAAPVRAGAPTSAPATEAYAQRRPRLRRAPVRIRVTPLGSQNLPPDAVRQCIARLVQEYRPSGTVIVPRMQCWWERG